MHALINSVEFLRRRTLCRSLGSSVVMSPILCPVNSNHLVLLELTAPSPQLRESAGLSGIPLSYVMACNVSEGSKLG